STTYTGHGVVSGANPLYSAIDIENGWVFTAHQTGFLIWDIGTNPELPREMAHADLRPGGCSPTSFWPTTPACSEIRHFIFGIDAPQGKDDILAVVGLPGVGMGIVDTSNKRDPRILYQDYGRGSVRPDGGLVYAATIGGRDYAFFPS